MNWETFAPVVGHPQKNMPYKSLRVALQSDLWYSNCSPELQLALVSLSRTTKLATDESLFHVGDSGGGMYCVLEGALLVSNVNDEGKVSVLSQVEPYQWFGEISLIDKGVRPFSARAICPTRILLVPECQLVAWLNEHPQCWRDIGLLACAKLRIALDAYQDLALLSLEQRILKRLHLVASGYGTRVVPRTHVQVPQDVVAQMMGVSRQSTNRALKSLEEAGLIERRYGQITLKTGCPPPKPQE